METSKRGDLASCESDGRAMSRLVPSPSELEAHETPLRRPTLNWLFISKPPIMKSKPSPCDAVMLPSIEYEVTCMSGGAQLEVAGLRFATDSV